ncbi:Beta-lactamase hydrolase-like protein [Marinomonas spartinae]|uniref:Beta-lactamase hydrolase-like protein n=1 Tax=Marinomonas spartinae TaxID=1792290 RepID=A0A1A8TFJ8_9GAMM|nr:TIGR01244 family sulfur transferase [Marinomonas spartinae]SBS32132.1 Beta-lactamase hydrolase-like protein [Marinomonas spartinae]SBS35456.1 Beta-lactamase hydrolase-like protein [Marinomonas spartinae]
MNDPIALDEMYFVGPQALVEDFAEIKAMGFERVINNRPDGESDDQPVSADLEMAAREHGLEYVYNPVNLSVLGQKQVSQQQASLEESKKTFAFCRTGTRSSAMWVLVNNAQGQDYQTLVDYVSVKGFDLARCEVAMQPLVTHNA